MPGQFNGAEKNRLSSSVRHGTSFKQKQSAVNSHTETANSLANNAKVEMGDTKAVFGWATIDGIKFPYLLREDKKFVAVRMVEMKLLSKYPSTYPDELKNRPPLMSHYVTEREVKLLNEINKEHCAGEYGSYQFSGQDLIVKLQDFEEFYSIVKKHFPDEVLKNLPQKSKVDGGWVQVNNTVVPFVFRNDFRFVPLSVIRYAAQLLVDVQVEGHTPTDEECQYFNQICKSAGLNFTFSKSTKLVMLNMVQSMCTPAIITELPRDDPFGAAEFKGDDLEPSRLPTQIAPDSVPSSVVNSSPGVASGVGQNQMGFPSGAGPPNSMAPAFPPSGTPYWMNPHMGIFPGYGPGAGPAPNPFLIQPNQNGPISPSTEVNNNRAHSKDYERPSSQGGNRRNAPMARRSSTGTPSPNGQLQSAMYGNPIRGATPSAAVGAPGMSMPPPGLLSNQALIGGNRMMIPMLPSQSPSEYQKLLQMVQMQQPAKSQAGQKGPPPLIPVDPFAGGRMPSAPPPNVTVARNSNIPKQGSRPRGRPPIISADEPKVRPQHASKPISAAMANESQATPVNPRVPIKRLDFEGKSMACLVKEGACYALMEALSRVFFPYVPMDEFRYAVEMVLSVPVMKLTDEEEQGFIRFYGLPTSKLKCKKTIKLVDFSTYLPQLRYMYKERAEAAAAGGASVHQNKSSSESHPGPHNFVKRPGTSTLKPSPPTSVQQPGQKGSAPGALKALTNRNNKRGPDAPAAHPPVNKKAKKRLDDMVNKLWSKNQSSSTVVASKVSEATESGECESSSESVASPVATIPTDVFQQSPGNVLENKETEMELTEENESENQGNLDDTACEDQASVSDIATKDWTNQHSDNVEKVITEDSESQASGDISEQASMDTGDLVLEEADQPSVDAEEPASVECTDQSLPEKVEQDIVADKDNVAPITTEQTSVVEDENNREQALVDIDGQANAKEVSVGTKQIPQKENEGQVRVDIEEQANTEQTAIDTDKQPSVEQASIDGEEQTNTEQIPLYAQDLEKTEQASINNENRANAEQAEVDIDRQPSVDQASVDVEEPTNAEQAEEDAEEQTKAKDAPVDTEQQAKVAEMTAISEKTAEATEEQEKMAEQGQTLIDTKVEANVEEMAKIPEEQTNREEAIITTKGPSNEQEMAVVTEEPTTVEEMTVATEEQTMVDKASISTKEQANVDKATTDTEDQTDVDGEAVVTEVLTNVEEPAVDTKEQNEEAAVVTEGLTNVEELEVDTKEQANVEESAVVTEEQANVEEAKVDTEEEANMEEIAIDPEERERTPSHNEKQANAIEVVQDTEDQNNEKEAVQCTEEQANIGEMAVDTEEQANIEETIVGIEQEGRAHANTEVQANAEYDALDTKEQGNPDQVSIDAGGQVSEEKCSENVKDQSLTNITEQSSEDVADNAITVGDKEVSSKQVSDNAESTSGETGKIATDDIENKSTQNPLDAPHTKEDVKCSEINDSLSSPIVVKQLTSETVVNGNQKEGHRE